MKNLFLVMILTVLVGCTLVKQQLKDKVLPIARKEILELVLKELDKMVEKEEITQKQREFLEKNLFKILVKLDKKVELMLTAEAE
jgi:hypothetical protein